MLACPNISCTNLGCLSAMSSIVAHVWRRSCSRIEGSPVLLRSGLKCFPTRLVPLVVGRTSPLFCQIEHNLRMSLRQHYHPYHFSVCDRNSRAVPLLLRSVVAPRNSFPDPACTLGTSPGPAVGASPLLPPARLGPGRMPRRLSQRPAPRPRHLARSSPRTNGQSSAGQLAS